MLPSGDFKGEGAMEVAAPPYWLKFFSKAAVSRITGTLAYTEGVRWFEPPLNLQNILYCVFSKYTLQALLLCSLNPKFYTGKRYKLYANFTFCFSFRGTSSPRSPTRALPLDPTWGLQYPGSPGPALTT